MDILQLILGLALVAAVLLDVSQTTLTVNGGGRLSSFLARGIWSALMAVHRRSESHRLLAVAGPLVTLTFVAAWFAMLWLGWTLIFASGDASVIQGTSKQLADASDLMYFVGFTIITLGVGDYVPQGAVWQALTVIASASGFFLFTMVISYIVSVISAAASARAFATQVTGLGSRGEELVASGWRGGDLSSLDLPLNSLSGSLAQMSHRYLAYPILLYYHARVAAKAPVVAVLILDEALTLLRFGVAEEARPNPAVLASARSAVRNFLDALPDSFLDARAEAPPPTLAALRRRGIPTVSEAEFDQALAELDQRRRRLSSAAHSDGWQGAA